MRRGSRSQFRTPHLFGRDAEVDALEALLRGENTRLVTIVGPGGVGKTALATLVLSRLEPEYADGVGFVQLAPVREAELVLQTIAHALGIREQPGVPIGERLTEVLSRQQILLGLDNLEHLPGAAPDLAALLEAAPGVRILASSRAPLNLRAEQRFPLGLLATAADPADLETFRRVPSVALFEERARSVLPSFQLTASNAPDVAAICAALDGLPLAIELAAARAAVFPPAALRTRLDQGLRMLAGGPMDVPPRLRGMADAIHWSYDLLEAVNQDVCCRLAVFFGGWTLEAAEGVASGPDVSAEDVLAALVVLVDNNLIHRVDTSDEAEPRYGMLETVLEFGLERLEERGGSANARDAHLSYFVSAAERAATELDGPRAGPWLDRLDADRDNLRAALRWAIDCGNREMALRLGIALRRFWDTRCYFAEGRAHLGRALALPAAVPAELIARALEATGELALWQNDPPAALAAYEQALGIWRDREDKEGIASALWGVAAAQMFSGNHAAVELCVHELNAVADLEAHPRSRALALYVEGTYRAHAVHDLDGAASNFKEQIRLLEELGESSEEADALGMLAGVEILRGNDSTAEALLNRMLTLAIGIGAAWNEAWYLEYEAALLVRAGHAELAARVLGAARAWRGEREAPVLLQSTLGEYPYDLAKAALGAGFESAFASGQRLALSEAIALAQGVGQHGAPVAEPPDAHGLTPRELEVAWLLARRLTDREIADALVVSPRTVTTHVAAILGKLGVASRRDVAAALGPETRPVK